MLNNTTVLDSAFDASPYIREIGRGKEGARSLTREQARELFEAVLHNRVHAASIGGLLIALRVKGETVEEMLGILDALEAAQPDCANQVLFKKLNACSQQSGKPVLIIPSYNGARRKANLTPLLAGLLAQRGWPVLVHGQGSESAGRVTTAQIWPEIDWDGCLGRETGGLDSSVASAVSTPVASAVSSPASSLVFPPVFASIETLHPGIAELLRFRSLLGVRSCIHSLVKMWVPNELNRAALITSYTHPEYLSLQTGLLAQRGVLSLVVRAHEGEPVAAMHRAPRMDAVAKGRTWCLREQEEATHMPDPRQFTDIAQTVLLTQEVLKGQQAVPPGIQGQIGALEELFTL